MRISVLGSGGWGTALALVLLDNGHDVTLWSYTQEESDVLAAQRENPLLKGVPLPQELKLTAALDCVKGCGAVVLATPSFAVRSTARAVAPLLEPDTVLISVSKGIEKDTSLTLTEAIAQEVGNRFPIVALSGPSHAEEVGRHVPTVVVSASKDRSAAELVQDLFMNERFRVYASDDVVGVELGAALKNVMALCTGCCTGMGYGDNTKAMLMTRGLAETARLGVALGGRRETFAGLAGMGDLIVTCTSLNSRNYRAGILIGQGVPVQEAIQRIGAVVEGYYAVDAARALADRVGVEMPITQAAYEVLYQNRDPKEAILTLMRREKRHEIEETWV